jgi:hypothetical protein
MIGYEGVWSLWESEASWSCHGPRPGSIQNEEKTYGYPVTAAMPVRAPAVSLLALLPAPDPDRRASPP